LSKAFPQILDILLLSALHHHLLSLYVIGALHSQGNNLRMIKRSAQSHGDKTQMSVC
jgi:hypothetical protein